MAVGIWLSDKDTVIDFEENSQVKLRGATVIEFLEKIISLA